MELTRISNLEELPLYVRPDQVCALSSGALGVVSIHLTHGVALEVPGRSIEELAALLNELVADEEDIQERLAMGRCRGR